MFGRKTRAPARIQRSLKVLTQLVGGTFTSKWSLGSAECASVEASATDAGLTSIDPCSNSGEMRSENDFGYVDISAENAKKVISGDTVGDEIQREEIRVGEGRDDEGGKGGDDRAHGRTLITEIRRVERGERFVAHMSTLTDIFKVEDKESTKKSQTEKEKDRGFRVTSLFDGFLPPDTTTAGNATLTLPETSTTGGEVFSFSFGGDAGQPKEQPGEVGVASKGIAELDARGGQVRPTGGSGPPGQVGISAEVPVDAEQNAEQSVGEEATCYSSPLFWRPLSDVVTAAARFVRVGSRADIEATWIHERHALTQDFKRKHKDAVKGRRGTARGGRGGARGLRGGGRGTRGASKRNNPVSGRARG